MEIKPLSENIEKEENEQEEEEEETTVLGGDVGNIIGAVEELKETFLKMCRGNTKEYKNDEIKKNRE